MAPGGTHSRLMDLVLGDKHLDELQVLWTFCCRTPKGDVTYFISSVHEHRRQRMRHLNGRELAFLVGPALLSACSVAPAAGNQPRPEPPTGAATQPTRVAPPPPTPARQSACLVTVDTSARGVVDTLRGPNQIRDVRALRVPRPTHIPDWYRDPSVLVRMAREQGGHVTIMFKDPARARSLDTGVLPGIQAADARRALEVVTAIGGVVLRYFGTLGGAEVRIDPEVLPCLREHPLVDFIEPRRGRGFTIDSDSIGQHRQ